MLIPELIRTIPNRSQLIETFYWDWGHILSSSTTEKGQDLLLFDIAPLSPNVRTMGSLMATLVAQSITVPVKNLALGPPPLTTASSLPYIIIIIITPTPLLASLSTTVLWSLCQNCLVKVIMVSFTTLSGYDWLSP